MRKNVANLIARNESVSYELGENNLLQLAKQETIADHKNCEMQVYLNIG